MAIPIFGFRKTEIVAFYLMLGAAIGGMCFSLCALFAPSLTLFLELGWGPVPIRFLFVQSTLIGIGALGARQSTFYLLLIGTAASIIPTPIGIIAMLPALKLLSLALARRRALRWKGPPPEEFV